MRDTLSEGKRDKHLRIIHSVVPLLLLLLCVAILLLQYQLLFVMVCRMTKLLL